MPKQIILGPRGESLIKSYEALRLEAYMPTKNDRPTIGWGHTRNVKMGMVINKEQAQIFFREDVQEAIDAIRSLPCALTESMADALISLVFNVGASAISSGSSIGLALRADNPNYFSAWRAFALWTKQGKSDLLGLARRRAKEMVLFLEDGLP
jgi:lysozyme